MNKLHIALLLSLLQTSAFAAKKEIHTDKAPTPIGTYSQAIKTGKVVYFSGQIAINPSTGMLVSDDFTQQVAQVFQNLKQVVTAAGGDLNDITKLTVYLTNLNDFAAVNEAMKPLFNLPYPARSAIEIKALPKGAKVEVEGILHLEAE